MRGHKPERQVGDFVNVIFDGPPSHESGRFVEVENDAGQSISFGEWSEREDGLWRLRFPVTTIPEPPAVEENST